MTDTYKTIDKPSEGIYKEKGSKFLSFAYPVFSEIEFKEIQSAINKKYHDARHRCFAYRIGIDENYRVNDDGEPSNSAGKPIYGQILSFDLSNILVYVVRYFGGTLLGVGGLIKAYKESAADALKNAQFVEKTYDDVFKISFQYEKMNEIMQLLKNSSVEQYDQRFEQDCELKFKIRKSLTSQILKKINNIDNIKTELLNI